MTDELDDDLLIMRALRRPGDEVQLERVLAAVCIDPDIARRFATTVLEHASYGNPDALGRLGAVPPDLHTSREKVISELVIGRRGLRQLWRAGRADLRLVSASGWELIVELKINAKIEPRQIRTYLMDAPTVVLARSARDTDLSGWMNDKCWLGLATWGDVLDDLRGFPLTGAVASDWLRILDVAERDSDFAPMKPTASAESQGAADLLEGISGELVEHLCDEVRRVHKQSGEPLALRLRSYKAYPAASTSAVLGLGVAGQPWLFTIRLSELLSRPSLRIERSVARQWRHGVGLSSPARRGRVLLLKAGRLEARDESREFKRPDATRDWIAQRLTEFVEHGALAPDVERLTQ